MGAATYKRIEVGPRSASLLEQMRLNWLQGEHAAVFGGTGSGKSRLARELYNVRLSRGGACIVFVCKLRPDETFTKDYAGWKRWTEYKKPSPGDRRILLWPKVEKCKTPKEALALQRDVFSDALGRIMKDGNWCVGYDEGLYMTDPTFLNLKQEIASMHYLGRSSNVTNVTLAQRPSNLPLVIYGSLGYVFTGATNLLEDAKRLSNLPSLENPRVIAQKLMTLGHHDFLFSAPAQRKWPTDVFNLVR